MTSRMVIQLLRWRPLEAGRIKMMSQTPTPRKKWASSWNAWRNPWCGKTAPAGMAIAAPRNGRATVGAGVRPSTPRIVHAICGRHSYTSSVIAHAFDGYGRSAGSGLRSR